jgi:hypothetical protein
MKKAQSDAAKKVNQQAKKPSIIEAPPVMREFPDGYKLTQPGLIRFQPVRGYHGTPHKIPIEEGFRMEKVGTGEGVQAYGHGLYFAAAKKVAEEYAKNITGPKATPESVARKVINAGNDPAVRLKQVFPQLSDAEIQAAIIKAQEKSGNLYTVDLLPDEADFLDWDKPLSEQSPAIQERLANFNRTATRDPEFTEYILSKPQGVGGFIYKALVSQYGDQYAGMKAVSAMLAEAGIPGIKYLDAGSRSAGEGSRNYVIFDDNLVKIIEENGKPVGEPTSTKRFQPDAASPSILNGSNGTRIIKSPSGKFRVYSVTGTLLGIRDTEQAAQKLATK